MLEVRLRFERLNIMAKLRGFLVGQFNSMENLDFQLVPQGSFSKAYSLTVFVIVILTIISRLGRKEGISIPGAPVVGAQSRWEPLLITKYRFPFGGWAVVYQGYKQVGQMH